MPRRKKPYVAPGRTLVNGGRVEVTDEFNFDIADDGVEVTKQIKVDIDAIRKNTEAFTNQFGELDLIESREQFIDDLVNECIWARTLRLDHLVKGRRTKPDEWTTQILTCGLATAMKKHGLHPTVSEYDDGTQVRRSLYLRLIPGLARIAGLRVPKDVKGHALRAKGITHEGK